MTDFSILNREDLEELLRSTSRDNAKLDNELGECRKKLESIQRDAIEGYNRLPRELRKDLNLMGGKNTRSLFKKKRTKKRTRRRRYGGPSSKKRTKKKSRKRRKQKLQFLYNPNNPKKSFDVYINKNPSDTIPIKYTTVKDVKRTIKK